MDKTDDPYRILGVADNESTEEIKRAYRKLALKHHPDKQSNDADRQKAQGQFAKIANAYEILSDEERRQQYDLQKKYGTPGDGKTYYTATQSSPRKTSQTRHWAATKPSSPTRTRTRTTTSPAGTSTMKEDDNGTFFFTTPLSSDGKGGFKDPKEIFRRFFGKDFDSRKGSPDIKVSKVSEQIRPSGQKFMKQSMPSSMRASNISSEPCSMSTSTRAVIHADGRIETITETTIVHGDGSMETTRSSQSVYSTAPTAVRMTPTIGLDFPPRDKVRACCIRQTTA